MRKKSVAELKLIHIGQKLINANNLEVGYEIICISQPLLVAGDLELFFFTSFSQKTKQAYIFYTKKNEK